LHHLGTESKFQHLHPPGARRAQDAHVAVCWPMQSNLRICAKTRDAQDHERAHRCSNATRQPKCFPPPLSHLNNPPHNCQEPNRSLLSRRRQRPRATAKSKFGLLCGLQNAEGTHEALIDGHHSTRLHEWSQLTSQSTYNNAIWRARRKLGEQLTAVHRNVRRVH